MLPDDMKSHRFSARGATAGRVRARPWRSAMVRVFANTSCSASNVASYLFQGRILCRSEDFWLLPAAGHGSWRRRPFELLAIRLPCAIVEMYAARRCQPKGKPDPRRRKPRTGPGTDPSIDRWSGIRPQRGRASSLFQQGHTMAQCSVSIRIIYKIGMCSAPKLL